MAVRRLRTVGVDGGGGGERVAVQKRRRPLLDGAAFGNGAGRS
jgi:hypothetical protein